MKHLIDELNDLCLESKHDVANARKRIENVLRPLVSRYVRRNLPSKHSAEIGAVVHRIASFVLASSSVQSPPDACA
jgi:hypothetical protein